MTIKTLHMTNSYHETSGGIRATYQAMLKAANQRGFPLVLVIPSECSTVEEVGCCGRIYHLRARRSPIFDKRYRLIWPTQYLFSRSGLWQILQREKPDLMTITDKYLLPYLGGLFRKGWTPAMPRPTLIGMSCERMDDNVRAFLPSWILGERFIKWYLGSIVIPQFDALIANSAYTAAELMEAQVERHYRPVKIATPGVDVSLFHPRRVSPEKRQQFCQRYGIPGAARLLLYAGRISPEKNPLLLVETLVQLLREKKNCWMVMAGEGPLKEGLAKMAEEQCEGKMIFTSHIGRPEELADLYANCDVFLHPNPREPFGIAPLEAMASGLPLVAPDSGGVRTYANSQNAWLAPPEGKAFAIAVNEVLSNHTDKEQRILRARRTAEEHSWENTMDSLFHLMEKVHREHLQTSQGCALPASPANSRVAAIEWAEPAFAWEEREPEKTFET